MSGNRLSVTGARTLQRYTAEILIRGFEDHGMVVVESEDLTLPALVQLHGAPHAEAEDRVIFDHLSKRIAQREVPTVVLFHRPDEIQHRFPSELSKLVAAAENNKVVFAFLGTSHLKDSAFSPGTIRSMAVPHGFFPEAAPLQMDPIVIGTHTTWGEMRSVAHAVAVLARVLAQLQGIPILGYLGGTPKSELQLTALDEMLVQAGLPAFELRHASRFDSREELPSYPLIVVSSDTHMPSDLTLTFNLQLYKLGTAVRTGENSGSLHSGVAIPVILEMNGAEELEQLEVIKIPYSDRADIESAYWEEGARRITEVITTGRFRSMLAHNATRARILNPREVVSSYLQWFQSGALPQ